MSIERPHVQRLLTSACEAHSSVHVRALVHTLGALADIEANSECVPSAEAAEHALNEAERELTPKAEPTLPRASAHEQPRVRVVKGERCPSCGSTDTLGSVEGHDFHCQACGHYAGAEAS